MRLMLTLRALSRDAVVLYILAMGWSIAELDNGNLCVSGWCEKEGFRNGEGLGLQLLQGKK